MTLTVGSLFSGIGGLDLGLEWAGMRVIWQSEIDPYASRVLAKHWPDVPNLGDVTTIDWTTIERPDLICGGYPCQPFSLAGARGGESDPRHLWPYFANALRVLRPRYALLENVPGHLSLGFGRVLGDLAELGFDAEWDCIPAAAVGAPHLRYRVFVVATNTDGDRVRHEPDAIDGRRGSSVAAGDGTACAVADADVERLPRGADAGGVPGVGAPRHEPARGGPVGRGRPVADTTSPRRRRSPRGAEPGAGGEQMEGGPAQPGGCGGAVPDTAGDGRGSGPGSRPRRPARHRGAIVDDVRQQLPDADRERLEEQRGAGSVRPERPGLEWVRGWAAEPDVGRVAHGVPARVDRLRALGNAVVPQVAEFVGRRIVEREMA